MIALRMTDRDIVHRVAGLFDSGVQFKRKADRKRKEVYCTEVYGPKAIAWAMTIYSFMGIRRKERIREMILVWKEQHMNRNIRRFLHAS
jgi:hypothetical protein